MKNIFKWFSKNNKKENFKPVKEKTKPVNIENNILNEVISDYKNKIDRLENQLGNLTRENEKIKRQMNTMNSNSNFEIQKMRAKVNRLVNLLKEDGWIN